MYHVYILYSPSLDRHYIGQTESVSERLRFHSAHATPFTAQAADWLVVFVEPVGTRQEAMALERRIKRAKNRSSLARYIRDPRNTVKIQMPIADG